LSIVNEAELILRLKNPETRSDAFSMLVRTYQERLYWHIRKMVISHDDAGDVLQNTLLKAWNGIEKFRGESLISTWLYRIATNETLSFLDNKRSRLMSNIDEVDDFLLKNLAADEYFDGNELETKLQKAIISLPDKQRLVFNMRYYDNIPYEEMETILGTSEGALKASYHHAVKKIEKFINDEK